MHLRAAVVAPGEPVHVELRLPVRQGEPPADRRFELELSDGNRNVLARRRLWTAGGHGELWLDPARPAGEMPLGLRVSEMRASGVRQVAAIPVGLDPFGAAVVPRLLDGYHSKEEDVDNGHFRWTTGCLLAESEDPGRDAVLHVEYACGMGEVGSLTVLAPGMDAVTLPCGGRHPRLARIALPHRLWSASPFLPIEIRADRPFVPAQMWDSTDERELGFQLYALAVDAGQATIP